MRDRKPSEPYTKIYDEAKREIRDREGDDLALLAHDYFDAHGLKRFLVKMIQELGEKRPFHPYVFLVEYLMANSNARDYLSLEVESKKARGTRGFRQSAPSEALGANSSASMCSFVGGFA